MFAVAQYLHLEVAGTAQEPFEIKRAATEHRLSFRLCSMKLMFKRRLVRGDANSAATKTTLAFNMTAKPMLRAAARASSSSPTSPWLPGVIGTPPAFAAARAAALSPMIPMASGVGPMKTNPAAPTASAKRLFSERSIAWMDCAGAGLARCPNNRVDVKITFGCRWRADADSFIGKPDGETILVGFAEHGNGAYVQLFRRTNDADGKFTAIGYQKLVKHACGSRGVDEQDGLSWLDRRLVIDEKARDLAAGVGMDLGKLLHHFDQSDDVSLRYPIAVLLVRWLFGRRPLIKNSWQRT